MGAVWLRDLADVLVDAGLPITVQSGWESRSNSSGGLVAVYGVVVHHTASPASWDGRRDSDYMTFQHDTRPVGNLYLDRTGRWWVQCAGASNTAGKGGPYTTSSGTIPLDKANGHTINVEAGNDGVGEPWPAAQLDSYVAGVAALCAAYALAPTPDVLLHQTWAPGRKIDPAGGPRYAPAGSAATWSLAQFRGDVAAHATTPEAPDMTPEQADQLERVAATVARLADLVLGDGPTTTPGAGTWWNVNNVWDDLIRKGLDGTAPASSIVAATVRAVVREELARAGLTDPAPVDVAGLTVTGPG